MQRRETHEFATWFTYRAVIFLLCSVFFIDSVQAVIVGSKNSASAQTFTIFPSVDSNNTILGYTRFEDGFMLEGATTSCTYEGYMPISGTVHLNKGRLTLKRDLVLSGVPLFLTTGRIEANSFALELPKNLPDFNLPEFNGFTLNVTASYHLGTHAAVPDALSLDWAMNNDYVAVGMRSVSARELRVLYFNGTTLTATVDAEIGREVACVRWHPTKRYLATALPAGSGNEFIIYEHKTHNGTLATLSGAASSGDGRAVAWHPSGLYLVVGTTDTTTRLQSYPVSMAGALGSVGTPATLPTKSVCRNALSFSPGGNQIVVGVEKDTTVNMSELLVYNFNGSLTLSTSLDIGTHVFAVDWNPTGSYIAAGLASGSTNVRVYDASTSGKIREVTTARVNESYAVNTVSWDKTGTYLAVGTTPKSAGRPEFALYYFNKQNKTLSLISSSETNDDIYSIRWSRNNSYIARGHQPVSSGPHMVYVQNMASDATPLVFKNGSIVCNSDVILKAPIHFIGSCKINGRGKRIIFQSNSGFVVRPGATVLFEDVHFQNVFPSSMRCLDDSGTVTLSNCSLYLTNDYTFSRGSILFKEDVTISGTNKFNYTTKLTSTIATLSRLFFNNNMTFSYAPLRANRTLINMTDETSRLLLDGCTLYSTRTGLTLSNGTLIIDNKVTISSDAKYDAESMQLSSDLNIVIRGAAMLELIGRVRYL
ncbi:WD40 repeat domain-containing protein [Candidatus Dependentiae bacterium]|nr:WD40 repeat domain-containing protein [Candidatus Dependentiae bacterium]